MSEDKGHRPGIDRELDLKAIVATGVGLAILLVAAAALMWPLSTGLRGFAARNDAPAPALNEALEQPVPPGPRLQADPEAELAAMRAEEEARLRGYAWVNEASGVARIPVARAMQIVVDTGLRAPGPETPASEEAPTP